MMPYGETLGFVVEEVYEGVATVTLAGSEALHNVFGYTHGGAIFSIADTAIGLAHLASINEGQTATTIESGIQYMRPVLAGVLKAKARAIKQGRTLSFYECDVLDEENRIMARVTATMMNLDQKSSLGRDRLHGADAIQAAN